MSFNEKLPEWNDPGIEPPQSKKDEGFSPGEKPPAQWFNWLFHRLYKAIQELREKVVIKVAGKGLSSNDYTTEEKIKLGGISKQATKVESSAINGNIKIDGVNVKVYEHPVSHPAAMIEESTTKRFVSDEEKNSWDAKETPSGAQEKATAALTAAHSYTDQEIGGKTIDDTLIPTTDTGLSVKILLSWLANMIKSITGKTSWRIKPTKSLEELNTDIGNHIANSVGHGTATKAEAQTGTSHASYMTPLRTKEAIQAQQAVSSVNSKTGPVTLTANDVGAFYQDNYGNVVTKSSSFTLSIAEKNAAIFVTAGATITIPNNTNVAFPIGTQIFVSAETTSNVTFVPSSGVTLRSKDTKRTIDGQDAGVTLIKRDTNIWVLIGALK